MADEVAPEIQRRDPEGGKTRLVLEKLWKAAFAFHREGSLEAELWVLDRALRVLSGGVSQVVKGLRQSVTKRQLSGAKRATLLAVASYLHRNSSPHAIRSILGQRLADCHRRCRRRLQELDQGQDGAFRHALDRSHG